MLDVLALSLALHAMPLDLTAAAPVAPMFALVVEDPKRPKPPSTDDPPKRPKVPGAGGGHGPKRPKVPGGGQGPKRPKVPGSGGAGQGEPGGKKPKGGG